MWLTAPWRLMSRQVTCLALTAARRPPRLLLALVVSASVVVAVVQAIQRQHWAVAVTLGGVAVAAVICPLADAAVSRHAEYAADRYAERLGLGPHLALALEVSNGGQVQETSLVTRALSGHPLVVRRIDRLHTTLPG